MHAQQSTDRPSPTRDAAWPHVRFPPGFDMDLFLVESDLRALGKWEGVPESALAAELGRIAAAGLESRVVPGPAARQSVVFFSRSPTTLDEAEQLEDVYRRSRSFTTRAPSSRRLGLLLGYPECCVERWATGPQEDTPALLRLGARLGRPAHPLLDFFPRAISPIGFLPCTLECDAALAQATRVCDTLETRHGVSLVDLEDALTGVVLSDGSLFVMFRGVTELRDAGFSYSSVVTPVDLAAFPDFPDAHVAIAETRKLAAMLRAGSELRVDAHGMTAYDAHGTVVHRGDVDRASRLVAFARTRLD